MPLRIDVGRKLQDGNRWCRPVDSYRRRIGLLELDRAWCWRRAPRGVSPLAGACSCGAGAGTVARLPCSWSGDAFRRTCGSSIGTAIDPCSPGASVTRSATAEVARTPAPPGATTPTSHCGYMDPRWVSIDPASAGLAGSVANGARTRRATTLNPTPSLARRHAPLHV